MILFIEQSVRLEHHEFTMFTIDILCVDFGAEKSEIHLGVVAFDPVVVIHDHDTKSDL